MLGLVLLLGPSSRDGLVRGFALPAKAMAVWQWYNLAVARLPVGRKVLHVAPPARRSARLTVPKASAA